MLRPASIGKFLKVEMIAIFVPNPGTFVRIVEASEERVGLISVFHSFIDDCFFILFAVNFCDVVVVLFANVYQIFKLLVKRDTGDTKK